MVMASTTRSTFTIDRAVADRARRLGVNISAAAREGVEAAVRAEMARADRDAYRRRPERPDPFWSEVEAWTEE
jgi:post-segregation antitoxin (ccd killing protein)